MNIDLDEFYMYQDHEPVSDEGETPRERRERIKQEENKDEVVQAPEQPQPDPSGANKKHFG